MPPDSFHENILIFRPMFAGLPLPLGISFSPGLYRAFHLLHDEQQRTTVERGRPATGPESCTRGSYEDDAMGEGIDECRGEGRVLGSKSHALDVLVAKPHVGPCVTLRQLVAILDHAGVSHLNAREVFDVAWAADEARRERQQPRQRWMQQAPKVESLSPGHQTSDVAETGNGSGNRRGIEQATWLGDHGGRDACPDDPGDGTEVGSRLEHFPLDEASDPSGAPDAKERGGMGNWVCQDEVAVDATSPASSGQEPVEEVKRVSFEAVSECAVVRRLVRQRAFCLPSHFVPLDQSRGDSSPRARMIGDHFRQ